MTEANAIVELIEDVLQVDVPAVDTDLIEAGLIDSLALVSLITEIERDYGIRLPLDEFDPGLFRTPARIAALVADLAPRGRVA